MKIVSVVARYLLGLIFVVFGLNGFLNFIHQPPLANPLAQQFLMAVIASHFAAFFFALQVLGGCCCSPAFSCPLR
jgi:putative oxidoreductase